MNSQLEDIDIERHGLKFRYRYVNRGPGPLFVSFPSARPADHPAPAYFSRLTWPKHIPCSFLFVSDPQVPSEKGVRVSGFQGRPEWFGVEEASKDIAAISLKYGHPEASTLLYGSSVGGSVALYVGSYLHQSRVIVECPQTSLFMAAKHMAGSANAIAQLCYDKKTVAEIDEKYSDRTSVLRAFQVRGKPQDITVFVRATDTPHLEFHARPLAEQFPDIKLNIMNDDSGVGHTALSIGEVKADIFRALGLTAN